MQRETRLRESREGVERQWYSTRKKFRCENKGKCSKGRSLGTSGSSMGELHMATILGEDGGNDLNLLAQRSLYVFPVPH